MDDPLDPAARFGSNRNDVAAAAQGDDGILERAGQLAGVDQLVQAAAEALVGNPDGPAQATESRRRGIEHLARRIEAPLEHVPQAGKSVDLAGQVVKQGLSVATQRLAQAGGRLES